jgi:hypothetical protein
MSTQKFEYATVMFETKSMFRSPSLDGSAFDKKLDEYGQEGWELVSTFTMNRYDGDTSAVVAVFKRPI